MGAVLLLTGVTALLTWLLSLLMLLAWSPSPQPLPSGKASSEKKKNVLLVVAHPDDESMFFAPTLLSLASLGCYHVRILSLSNGNAEGLGAIREQEMLSACSFLKVPRENVDILDDPALQDGQSVIWRPTLISQVLERTVTSHEIDMESVGILKKYSGPIYGLWSMWRYRTSDQSHQFFSRGPLYCIQAMQKHATQWLWYRRLFVVFSHYSYMNTLHRFST